jgi:hypothetical protein
MSAFPDIPLDVRAELQVNNAWTNVTHYLDQGPVSIARGHPDESTTVSPSTLAMTLTNSDYRFSANSVTGPYYPYLVQNVPCRVSVPAPGNYLRLENDAFDRAFINDVAALHITGSIEMRIQLALTDWQGCVLAAKWDGGGCWTFLLNDDATLSFGWVDSGVVQHSVTSTVPVPLTRGAMALRVTMDATTGTVAFYTATSIDGTYTALGTAASGTGGAATSILSLTTSALVIGYSFSLAALIPVQLRGQVQEYRLYSGIGGTVVADGVFSGQAAGTTTWTDSAGRTWLTGGGAEISDRDYRAHAEIAEFPEDQPPADPGTGVIPALLAPVAGGGLLRRLGQGNNPARSAIFRAWAITGVSLAAYWSMEDGTGAQSLASGIGGQPMYYSGSPQLASNSDFACSDPLPQANLATFSGKVGPYGGTWAGNQVSWLMELASGGEFNTAEVIRIATSGTVAGIVVRYATGGGLVPFFYASDGTLLAGGGTVLFAANGVAMLFWISLAPDGAGGVNWEIAATVPGGSAGAASGNIASATVGAVTRVALGGSGQLTTTVFGHVAVQAATGDLTPLDGALNAWDLEAAGSRMARICGEEGIPFRAAGILGGTAAMGPQASQTVTALVQECADADRGAWFELRQQLGWGYVPRSALYNQAAAVALDYAADQLGEWPSPPTRDDQAIANDVTVTQSQGGSSARAIAAPGNPVTGGRLAALPPKQGGVGTYDGGGASLNLGSAEDLPGTATWMVHVGTVDEHRLPGIAIDLANRGLGATLSAQVAALDLGQRLTIAHPPGFLGPDTVSQLAAQLAEEVFSDVRVITVCGIPSAPYRVAQEGTSTGKADTDGCVLASAASSGATSLLAANAGLPWSTSPGLPWDLRIAGERVTVTAVGSGGTGSATTPAAHAQLITTVPLPPGTWLVGWTVQLGGTVGANELNNFTLATEPGGALVAVSVNAAAAGTYVQAAALVTISGSLTGITVKSGGNAATSGAVYTATITSPQALTVTRSVNGVVKAQAAAAAVALWDTPVAAL